MSQQGSEQRVGSCDAMMRGNSAHGVLAAEGTEAAVWQRASVATMTTAVRDSAADTGADTEATNAGGSGWAIELQETQLLVRRVFPLPSSWTMPIPPDRETGDPAPRLGRRPLALTLLCCLVLLIVVGALDGMQQYARIHAQVDDALRHLRAAQSLLAESQDARQPGQPLTAETLAQVSTQLNAAETDFAALRTELGSPAGVVLVGRLVPRLSSRIAAAVDLARAGDDACQGLADLVTAANDLLALRADGFLDARGQLTRAGLRSPAAAALLLHLHTALASAAGPLDAAARAISPADLGVLPPTLASSADLATLSSSVATWPQTRAQLLAPDGWRLLVPLVLGTPTR